MGKIIIKLMSDLCVGNGESVGYGIDSDICADNYGFPYIPGKRLLGCLRETAEQLKKMGLEEATEENICEIFGDIYGKEGKLIIGNAVLPEIESLHEYINRVRDEGEKDYIIRQSTEEKIIRQFSTVRGQTKIGNNGKAENGSLRFIRVLNQYSPFTNANIEFLSEVDSSALDQIQKNLVKKSCMALRHIGMNRNRGLGNIFIIPELEDEDEVDKINIIDESDNETEMLIASYKVHFNTPITLQEYNEEESQIKARTLIGVFAKAYLNKYKNVDAPFKSLFLDGTVKWSALTPVINSIISEPVPSMIKKLKNGGGKIINSFTEEDYEWKKKKPKSLDGSYMSTDINSKKSYIASPETEVNYHNRINDSEGIDKESKGLYIQDALKEGMVYGGTIVFPRKMKNYILDLLSIGKLRIGRSKKVQYGEAEIINITISNWINKRIRVGNNEPIFAILRSDLVLQKDASFRIDNEYVRDAISQCVGLENKVPEGFSDVCRYHILSGYNTMWQLQKPKIPAIMGGSVYCFSGVEGEIPSEILIGEFQQEGLGSIKLVTRNQMNELADISYGLIDRKSKTEYPKAQNCLKNMLLLEAAKEELREYAFRFKKNIDDKKYKYENNKSNKRDEYLSMKDVPSGRLRQMLHDSDNLKDLWKMINSMKISDVSSESNGKKNASILLIKELYGESIDSIDIEIMIDDEGLLEDIKNNNYVYDKVLSYWKEPLSTLLHMIHYQKGGRN